MAAGWEKLQIGSWQCRAPVFLFQVPGAHVAWLAKYPPVGCLVVAVGIRGHAGRCALARLGRGRWQPAALCRKRSICPSVWGERKMEATSVCPSTRSPGRCKNFPPGIAVAAGDRNPGRYGHAQQTNSVKNRRMNPPRPASSNRGTVSSE